MLCHGFNIGFLLCFLKMCIAVLLKRNTNALILRKPCNKSGIMLGAMVLKIFLGLAVLVKLFSFTLPSWLIITRRNMESATMLKKLFIVNAVATILIFRFIKISNILLGILLLRIFYKILVTFINSWPFGRTMFLNNYKFFISVYTLKQFEIS